MVEIKSLEDEDIIRLDAVFEKTFELFNDVDGVYYKMFVDGEEKILRVDDYLYTIFSIKGTTLFYEMFTVDEDNKVYEIAFDEYDLHPSKEYGPLFYRKGTEIIESLVFEKREDGVDYQGYTGRIVYTQHDTKNDIRVCITYQQDKEDNDNRINFFRLKEPLEIAIDKDVKKIVKGLGSKQRFVKREINYDKDPLFYKIATIKDFGIEKVLRNHEVSLQKSYKIVRYYKELYVKSNGYAITGFPLCKQYKYEEILELVKQYGFKTELPQVILDYYNGDCKVKNYYQEVVDALDKVLEDEDTISNVEGMVLVLNPEERK